MSIDPAVARMYAENVRAKVIPKAHPTKLAPALVQKIRETVPVFKGMPLDCLNSTLLLGEHVTFKAGEVVFNEGDLGDSFFVLLSGRVVIEKNQHGRRVELARLGVVDCFGEMALVGLNARSATVRALVDTVTMRFYGETVDANVTSASYIYRNIANILAKRLKESSVTLANLTAKPA